MERPRVSADWDTWDHDPGHVSQVSPRTQVSESSLNSMEYWDYSVELECITGQQGRLEFHALKEETTLSVVLSAGGGAGGVMPSYNRQMLRVATATMSHYGEL